MCLHSAHFILDFLLIINKSYVGLNFWEGYLVFCFVEYLHLGKWSYRRDFRVNKANVSIFSFKSFLLIFRNPQQNFSFLFWDFNLWQNSNLLRIYHAWDLMLPEKCLLGGKKLRSISQVSNVTEWTSDWNGISV